VPHGKRNTSGPEMSRPLQIPVDTLLPTVNSERLDELGRYTPWPATSDELVIQCFPAAHFGEDRGGKHTTQDGDKHHAR
jgi:hypothetical protein